MTSLFSLRLGCVLLGMASLLTGCAGMRLIDNDVSTFTRWPAAVGAVTGAPGTTYRFERLPSQEGPSPVAREWSQDQLEAATVQALARHGWVLKPDAALLTVQVGLVTVVQPAAYGDGIGFPARPGVSLGAGTGGSFIGLSFPVMRSDPPLYLRELSLVLRDSRNNAVLYETRARHSGVWSDGRAVGLAMLEAALDGFPNPSASTRRVKVEIPR